MNLVCVVLLLGIRIGYVHSSLGDRTYYFQKCSYFCINKFCILGNYKSSKRFPDELLNNDGSLVNKLEFYFRWRCHDECKYVCMWRTVRVFQSELLPVPQFFGRWPLIRMFGIQEVASTLASFCNLIITVWIFIKFTDGLDDSYPTYQLWCIYFILAIIAWCCAMMFHICDTFLTERLDYFSFLLTVLHISYICIHRTGFVGFPLERLFAYNSRLVQIAIGVLCGIYFIIHVCYMSLRKFDYKLNMIAFIGIGLFNIVNWTVWAIKNLDLPQSKYILIYCLMIAAFSTLEFLDFTPLFYVIDAHSLWHMSTIISPIPLYQFAKQDCLYLKTYGQRKIV